MARFASCLLVGLAGTGCALGPRYSERAPAAPQATGCRVAAADVQIFSDGSTWGYTKNLPRSQPALASAESSTSIEVTSSGTVRSENSFTITTYPDFGTMPDLIAPAGMVPTGSRWVGDVRTRNLLISPAAYELLVCGFTPGHDPTAAMCRDQGRGVIDGLLDQLRTEAAAVGANAVYAVRCFGSNQGSSLRVWCEACAYLTPEFARRGCAG